MTFKLVQISPRTKKHKLCSACAKPTLNFRIERYVDNGTEHLCLNCVMHRHDMYLKYLKGGIFSKIKAALF